MRRFLVEPDSLFAEPFRTLRVAIEPRLASTETRGLVFTSPRGGDGKSTVASNYAVVTAFVQRPVLLIDADMRRPRLHEMFDRPRAPGLVDALRERLDLSEVVHTFPALGGLHVMTAGSPLARPGDVAASAAMRGLATARLRRVRGSHTRRASHTRRCRRLEPRIPPWHSRCHGRQPRRSPPLRDECSPEGGNS